MQNSRQKSHKSNQQHLSLSRSLLQLHQVQQQLKEDKKILKKSKNVFVGTGFTIDLTQYFKFRKRENVESGQAIGSIFYEVSGSGISWVILAYSLVNASFIPVWILTANINKFVALAWRYILQSLLMLPFVLYQRRTIQFEHSHQYQLNYIFNTRHLKKLYLCSFAHSLWYFLILTAAQATYLSHALYLGSLTNFFLSLARHKAGYVHQYQIGGQVAVLLGIFFTMLDTYYFRNQQISTDELSKLDTLYLSRTKWQRMAADITCLTTSIIMSRFQKYTTGLYTIFPPYLCMLIINILNVVNLSLIAYFFNGVTFDLVEYWGFFGILADSTFPIFLSTAVILTVGFVISFMLVANMFPNFVIPSIAYFLEPGLATLLFSVAGVQALPRSFSLIGYTIMTPGMFLISIGQWLFLRNKKRQQILQSIHYIELKQLSLHKINSEPELKKQQERVQKKMKQEEDTDPIGNQPK